MDNFKFFLKFIRQNKFHTALNLLGFSVSLMFVVLFGLYLKNEYSVDKYHLNKDRVFRLRYSDSYGLPVLAGEDLKANFPEIESAVVMMPTKYRIYQDVDKKNVTDEKVLAVDSCFFDLFTYRFMEGSPLTALKTKQDAVISKSLAVKLFGNQQALGREVKTEKGLNFIVSGVVEDVKNSHLKNFSLITLISNYTTIGFASERDRRQSYDNSSYELYLLERANANLCSKLDYIEKYLKDQKLYWLLNRGFVKGLVAEPLEDIYFNATSANSSFSNNDPAFLLTIGITILLVLLFAVINYVNLNVAQIGFRAREISLRRLLGASKTELFIGFIAESFVLCAAALSLALLMALFFRGWFCGVMETTISVSDVFVGYNALVLFCGLVVLSVVAGFVPAVIVIQNRPIDIVNGNFKRKTKTIYSKALIGFQYAISIVLIGCCVLIIQQVRYMTTVDLGYNKEHIIVCGRSLNAVQRDAYRAKLLGVQGVEQVGFSNGSPASSWGGDSFTASNGVNYNFTLFDGDSEFFSILGLDILRKIENASSDAVWLNETAWRKAGLTEDAGVFYVKEDFEFPLRGMIRDFHFDSFEHPIEEVMIGELQSGMRSKNILIKISPSAPYETFRRIEKAYNDLAGGNYFDQDADFLDKNVAALYEKQDRLLTMIGWLTIVSVIISSMGVLAMSIYQARQRTKEIAVRKIFGAENREVLKMILFGWLKMASVAFFVAIPVIILLGREWLSHYAYRISIGWSVFLISGFSVIAFAALTVMWQSIRTAYSNPVDAIKKE